MSNNSCQDSKFKLCFKLKQHTPIIHFQSDQTGATLRATELKPKLDKFLIKYAFDNDFEKYKEYLIGYKEPKKPTDRKMTEEDFLGKKAFDYKVKILNQGENKIDFPKPFVKRGTNGYVAPYFADNKSIEHQSEIKLFISSFDESILTAIKKYITLFFTFENFGTRQSKGFGSYHLSDTTKDDFKKLIKQYHKPVYYFSNSFHSAKDALKEIDTFYRKLKAGLNPKANQGKHFKSLLFKYMCTKDSGWEKKWIKEKFPEVVYGEHKPINCEPPKSYHYIRALLGLAELNEYYPNGQRNKLQIKIEGVKKDPDDNKKVLYQRFKSPITFKIFESNVYLLHNDSYKELFGEKFYFRFKGKKEIISIPEQFNLDEFLKFVQNEISYLKELS